jgi:hypothetical protein
VHTLQGAKAGKLVSVICKHAALEHKGQPPSQFILGRENKQKLNKNIFVFDACKVITNNVTFCYKKMSKKKEKRFNNAGTKHISPKISQTNYKKQFSS